ncbi:MAG: hypothetical protein KKE50_06065, partial [Nanoarchaeota archaeon]|nr:hypothetical protein [Nanoarchaeota archaeon]
CSESHDSDRCGLFWVFWTSNSLEFDGSQSSVNSDVLRKGQLFTTVCTLKCAVYFSDIKIN